MKKPRYLVDFDSASAMLRATARFLHGMDFPQLGRRRMPDLAAETLVRGVNALPLRAREFVYSWSGAREAIPPDQADEVQAEELSRWVVGEYPERQYPAAFIGSSNGALVHLYAALGVPWLPQTFLIAIKGRQPVDEPKPALERLHAAGKTLLAANPELALHHMHDPGQDRLMLARMAYFRVKRLRLGEVYARFLERRLAPGATIFVVDCRQRWPTTRLGERHVFQFGAVGGLEIEEYFRGGPRVRDYLQRYGSAHDHWDAPTPDGESPEAEWGLAPELLAEVAGLAARSGYRLRRIVFDDPMDLSPLVADLYRWWYLRRGLPDARLVGDSFILMEPYWTLRTASVPFWTTFNVQPAANRLEAYLETSAPFEEIYQMLFSHGVRSVGVASITRWRELLDRAARRGNFLGVDANAYPADFATFARYHTDFQRKVAARYPLPTPLTLAEFDAFLDEHLGRHAVHWHEDVQAGQLGTSQHT